MITLAIGKDRITIIPIEGEEIWTDITINKCYQDRDKILQGFRNEKINYDDKQQGIKERDKTKIRAI